MALSIVQRLAMIEPPLWAHLSSLTSEPWLTLFEQLADARAQGIHRGQPLTATLRVTEDELADASTHLISLFELLLALDLLDVTSTVEVPA